MRTRVKICGFTRTQDALNAARLGVDAIGLVFYPPSPRHIEISTAMGIVGALPAFTTVVGLFVDAQAAEIYEVMANVPIDCLQFHGDERPDYCRSFGKRYIKAVRMQAGVDVHQLAQDYYDADGLLLDAYHAHAKGGSGVRFDWDLIPNDCSLPIILAGGLDSSNAKAAIAAVRPYALDVSSGVEAGKGIKDTQKMRAFIMEVMQEDTITL